MAQPSATRRERPGRGAWALLSRAVAGVLGGYLLAQVLAVALVAPWSLPRTDAVLVAMQLGLVLHAIAILVAFAARSALRAWALLGAAALAGGAVVWIAR